MNDNLAKTISTVAIWLATALIFVSGICRMNVNGFGLFIWGVIAVALAIAPAVATHAIWNRPSPPVPAKDKSSSPEN